MKEYIIRLSPRSPFEIALHSDTLFGALCWGIRTLFGERRLLNILSDFDTEPPFLISSAFPWYKVGSDRRYYLPRPFLPLLKMGDIERIAAVRDRTIKRESYHSDKHAFLKTSGDYKTFRKIKWIPLTEFRLTTKDMSEENQFTRYLDSMFAEADFCTSSISQKNSLDRLTNSTAGSGKTFYQSEMVFRNDHGLYFLLRAKNMEDYLKPVLLFLEDSGIGPNARTGRNWFSVESEESQLFPKNEGNAFVTLSRYAANEDLDADRCCYQLAFVRSKVESRHEFAGEDVWKDRITYFVVGSVIVPNEKKDFYGRLAPVKEIAGSKIRQYGYAYPVWVNMGEKL